MYESVRRAIFSFHTVLPCVPLLSSTQAHSWAVLGALQVLLSRDGGLAEAPKQYTSSINVLHIRWYSFGVYWAIPQVVCHSICHGDRGSIAYRNRKVCAQSIPTHALGTACLAASFHVSLPVVRAKWLTVCCACLRRVYSTLGSAPGDHNRVVQSVNTVDLH